MSDESSKIDTAALQAQIDLSLSLTFDLVSSWVDEYPASKGVSGVNQNSLRGEDDYQKEIQNYLQRPSTCLGVGAPIPSSSAHASSRDVARLKGNLLKASASKKRSRDEYDADTARGKGARPNMDEDNDEEDSRSGMIRSSKGLSLTSQTSTSHHATTSRLSIFDGSGKKKKKKKSNSEANDASSMPAPSSAPESSAQHNTLLLVEDVGDETSPVKPVSSSPTRYSFSSNPSSPTISRVFPSPFDPPTPSPPTTPSSPSRPLSSSSRNKQTTAQSTSHDHLTDTEPGDATEVESEATIEPSTAPPSIQGESHDVIMAHDPQTGSPGKKKKKRRKKNKQSAPAEQSTASQ
ncbi:hypothetical protein DL93DRAFT_2232529 [Clavulina sp. PMI_390]|nr:hypothetical protein DL93DRAFT_2232529 [Clavulina sp. PMI_390]